MKYERKVWVVISENKLDCVRIGRFIFKKSPITNVDPKLEKFVAYLGNQFYDGKIAKNNLRSLNKEEAKLVDEYFQEHKSWKDKLEWQLELKMYI